MSSLGEGLSPRELQAPTPTLSERPVLIHSPVFFLLAFRRGEEGRSFFFFFSFLLNLSTLLLMSLSLFCWLVHFVHYIPHISETIWYLSFSDWLLSLSIMLSRSIHAVANGKIPFLFFYS